MVRGLDLWKVFFADYTDNYVLIGGAACHWYEDEYSQNPRATKDLDLAVVYSKFWLWRSVYNLSTIKK